MKLNQTYLLPRLMSLCVLLICLGQLHAQETAITALDNYFNRISDNPASSREMFMEQARITTVTYDAKGLPTAKSLKVDAYLADLINVSTAFAIKLQPVVLVTREHSHAASIYCSVYGRFAPNQGNDSIIVKSMQSFKMVQFNGHWKISGITIQNEAPSSAIPEAVWPEDLTYHLFKTKTERQKATAAYDPNKIYTVGQVDERPVYPGENKEYLSMLGSFGASDKAQEGKTPFTIVINEDGEARLDYVNDLSGAQIEQAKKLVAAMIPWYPALFDKASVKCRKVLYISE